MVAVAITVFLFAFSSFFRFKLKEYLPGPASLIGKGKVQETKGLGLNLVF
jgi:hypothetical protein